MWLYSWVIDKYNTMFQNVKRVFHQNKAHTKISQGLQFFRSISYTFIFPAAKHLNLPLLKWSILWVVYFKYIYLEIYFQGIFEVLQVYLKHTSNIL